MESNTWATINKKQVSPLRILFGSRVIYFLYSSVPAPDKQMRIRSRLLSGLNRFYLPPSYWLLLNVELLLASQLYDKVNSVAVVSKSIHSVGHLPVVHPYRKNRCSKTLQTLSSQREVIYPIRTKKKLCLGETFCGWKQFTVFGQ